MNRRVNTELINQILLSKEAHEEVLEVEELYNGGIEFIVG